MHQELKRKYAGDVTPNEAWKILETEDQSVLVDCRTKPEWSYVGVPNLSPIAKKHLNISWQIYPEMEISQSFQSELKAACSDKNTTLLFLCRSGVRSIDAAVSATEAGYTNSYNILEGFEGDKDEQGHRGAIGGWKFHHLPWRQG
tara:strand:- start:75 stop:509 length:435 start_codon:yes stop_codon:yes gene_type:complete